MPSNLSSSASNFFLISSFSFPPFGKSDSLIVGFAQGWVLERFWEGVGEMTGRDLIDMNLLMDQH